MSERFFSSHPIAADRVRLDGPEAHHLLHVMRATVGDEVTLFDGSGAEFSAVVESLHRSEVEVRIVRRLNVDRELPFALTIGVALPKGDRQKWLVEKLTELGVTTLVPLITGRGVAQPVEGALDRLRRVVVEAAKQCGRNRLMQIADPKSWSDWLTQSSGSLGQSVGDAPKQKTGRLIAHPGGVPVATFFATEPIPTYLSIGPEGGLSDVEIASATAGGWQLVDLGPRILRVETAAVALTAAVVAASSSS